MLTMTIVRNSEVFWRNFVDHIRLDPNLMSSNLLSHFFCPWCPGAIEHGDLQTQHAPFIFGTIQECIFGSLVGLKMHIWLLECKFLVLCAIEH